jgi:hypothetical protein
VHLFTVVGEAELLRSTNTVYTYFLCNWIIIVATIALLSAEASRITRMQLLNKAMKHCDPAPESKSRWTLWHKKKDKSDIKEMCCEGVNRI